MTPAEAAKYLLRLQKAENDFEEFVRLMHPEFDLQPFQLELIRSLDKLAKRELVDKDGIPITRVLINMPPRHAKSTLASKLFPAWLLGFLPKTNVLAATYGQSLADKFGREVRDYTQRRTYQQIFPDFLLDPTTRAKNDWAVSNNPNPRAGKEGGGSFFMTGLEGSTTGRPANVLIIDDPIKNRKEAESITYRNKVWDFYVSSLENRKEPDYLKQEPIEIVILTRWHPDDLAARLEKTDDWKKGRWLHFNYPAWKEKKGVEVNRSMLPPDHPKYLTKEELAKTGSKVAHLPGPREALWPERFPIAELERKRTLNPREFDALYLQSPYIRGGNLIRSDWFRFYRERPDPSDFISVIISGDTAFKNTTRADYSVLQVWGLHKNGDIYLLDQIRDKLDYPDLKRRAIQLSAVWRGRGLRGMYIEPKSSGTNLIDDLRAETGISVIASINASLDKYTKVSLVLPLIEGGRVYFPETEAWVDGLVEELEQFPDSTHDDQADALAIGLEVLSRVPTSGLNNFGSLESLVGTSLNQSARSPDGQTKSLRDLLRHGGIRALGH